MTRMMSLASRTIRILMGVSDGEDLGGKFIERADVLQRD
jgi:hypothetical protein